MHLVCTLQFFLFLLRVTVVLRETEDNALCIYRMFVGQTKFMTGDVQMAIGTQSRL